MVPSTIGVDLSKSDKKLVGSKFFHFSPFEDEESMSEGERKNSW